MKNKYEKCFQENEGKMVVKEKTKVELLKLKYYLQVLTKSGFSDFKFVTGMNINFIIQSLGTMNDYWQEWIRNNIINRVDQQSLMLNYISCLNYFLATKDYKRLDIIIDSFKKSNIIKDIKLNKGVFYLLTLDNQYIKFTNEFKGEKNIKICNKHCHEAVEYFCKNVDDIYAVTAIMKNYFGKTYYHSFVVKEGIVHDLALNTVMSLENYKKLFGCKIIMFMEGKHLLRNIERLKERDVEYKENEMFDVLKYAMHKQMKKERNIVR